MKAGRLHIGSQSQRLLPLTPILLLLFALILVFGSGEAAGQQGPGPDSDRQRADLEETDRLIANARDRLAESSNERAEQLLEQAIELQGRAWEAFHDNRHQFMMQVGKQARDLALKALGLLQRGSENLSFVEQELERTADILDDARTALAGSAGELAQTLLEQAFELQERGREMMHQHHLRQAVQLSLRARKLAHEILGGPGGPERRQHQIERFAERLRREYEEVSLLATDNEAARLLLEQAVELYERADELATNGHWDQAAALLSQAAGHLRRARQLSLKQDAPTLAERALDRAEARWNSLQDRAHDLDNSTADQLLAEAAEKLNKAREYQETGEHRRALVTVRVVMELLQRAERILGEW